MRTKIPTPAHIWILSPFFKKVFPFDLINLNKIPGKGMQKSQLQCTSGTKNAQYYD
jgi:hypothetical protein